MSRQDELIRLAGNDPREIRPTPPFAPLAMDFLSALSDVLRNDPTAKTMGDIQAFAFWCRRANLERLRKRHLDDRPRLGRGLVFHVAPANVPVNFAFSLAFGLLAGNANIVRVPSRPHPAVETIAAAMASLLAEHRFAPLARSQTLIRYAPDSDWSARHSARADARIIWGGDATVAALRTLATPPRCVDVTFADRTSLCVMDPAAVAALDEDGLERLAHAFYNDTYLMDQNACSSPHLVLWLGAPRPDAAERFWDALARRVARDYRLAPVQAVDKVADLMSAVLDGEPIAHARLRGAGLMVAELAALPDDLAERRGRFGLFREMAAASLNVVAPLLDGRFQTMTCFGLPSRTLAAFVTEHGLAGIDRIVPVGQALDMDLIWDGYDLIGQLSRLIDLR